MEETQEKEIEEGIKNYILNLRKGYNSREALLKLQAHPTNKLGKRQEQIENKAIMLAIKNPNWSTISKTYPRHNIVFSNILGNDEDEKYEKIDSRWYINCMGKNIGKLAIQYMKTHDELYPESTAYFKIQTIYELQKNARNDTFIIYGEKKQEQEIYQILQKIQQKHPKLFEGAEKRNPFMTKGKLDFVSEAKEPKMPYFSVVKNQTMKLQKSFNNYLNYTLEEAFKLAIGNPALVNEDIQYNVEKSRMIPIQKITDRMKKIVAEAFQSNSKVFDETLFPKEIPEPVEMIDTPWIWKNNKNKDTSLRLRRDISKKQYDNIDLIEVASEIKGLKRYIIRYDNTSIRTIYSEGIDFRMILQYPQYADLVRNSLLSEKRLAEKEKEAQEYGIQKGNIYIGTIGANNKGKLCKVAEQRQDRLKKIYQAIHQVERSQIQPRNLKPIEEEK